MGVCTRKFEYHRVEKRQELRENMGSQKNDPSPHGNQKTNGCARVPLQKRQLQPPILKQEQLAGGDFSVRAICVFSFAPSYPLLRPRDWEGAMLPRPETYRACGSSFFVRVRSLVNISALFFFIFVFSLFHYQNWSLVKFTCS